MWNSCQSYQTPSKFSRPNVRISRFYLINSSYLNNRIHTGKVNLPYRSFTYIRGVALNNFVGLEIHLWLRWETNERRISRVSRMNGHWKNLKFRWFCWNRKRWFTSLKLLEAFLKSQSENRYTTLTLQRNRNTVVGSWARIFVPL